MNANAFRHFYDYHFSENRKIWDTYVTALSQEQFTQHVDYSIGSVRNQIVHLMSVDDTWFSGLRGVEIPESLNPANFDDRKIIHAHWDNCTPNGPLHPLGRGWMKSLEPTTALRHPNRYLTGQ